MARTLPVLAGLLGLALAQIPGNTKDNHPKLTTWECTKAGGCKSQDTSVVIDASSHWIHQKADQSKGCGSWGSPADKSACPDVNSCQANCIIEGISDYSTYGVKTSGGSLTMKQLKSDGTTASPRLYLLAPGGDKYEMMKLTGKELAFDVDASKLPCGMNGALYLSEMAEDGGASLTTLKTGGAAYGSGYCDAQCFTTPFINGVGNVDGKGACCNEMDIWEANAAATALTPHTCSEKGLYKCSGAECAFNGTCDQWGCSYNTYIQGSKNFYGKGSSFAVDTSKPFTVVTQFPANDDGLLTAIKRVYVQNGKVIPMASTAAVASQPSLNYINEAFCNATASTSRFQADGGMKGIGDALARGMVLAFSIWWDDSGNMTWLDSGNAGPCSASEGNPAVIQKVQPDPTVVFSNIKWGEIDSTYKGSTSSSRLF